MSCPLCGRLYLSGIDETAPARCRALGLGLEITEFCYAPNLDDPARRRAAAQQVQGIAARILHAPFSELFPCAVDPRARQLTRDRYVQTLQAARQLGVRRVVFHANFLPNVYFPDWFLSQSADFFRALLAQEPAAQDMELLLENVLEPRPALLTELVRRIGDARVGLCLDLGHAATMASELPALDWIAPMAPYLRHVHLHNNEGREDLHHPLCQGIIPMRQALDALLRLDPDITFTIENQDCAPSLDFLAAHGLWEANK